MFQRFFAKFKKMRLATAGAVVAVVVAGLAGLILKNRADAIEDATTTSGNLATILAEQVDHALDAMDTSLRTSVRMVGRWSAEEYLQRTATPEFVEGLKSERITIGLIELMAFTNEAGDVIAGSRGKQYLNINVGDRDYFRTLRDDPTKGLVVTKALVSRASGKPMIFLARRLNARDGRFLGITFLGVEPASLLKTEHPLVRILGQSFSLFDRDGGLLMRHPEATLHTDVGRPIEPSSQWHAIAAAGGGLYHSDGYFDFAGKYVAVRPLKDYPLAVNVAISDAAVLSRWRSRSMIMVVATAIALATMLASTQMQAGLRRRLAQTRLRAWMRAERLSAQAKELANVNTRFALTLDYTSHAMAMFDAQGCLIVSNRCYAEFYDLEPERLQPGMHAREIFELRIAAGAYSGDPDDYRRIAFNPDFADRLDHLRNGRIIQTRTKQMGDGGWVTMQEDITERYAASERLSHAALHDGLTDLPNRMGFKKHIAEPDCCRLRDDSQVVALVDIDGFKLVNDSFGHEIGDAVLVEVAARLRNVARDAFVARLGGDEFVVSVCRSTSPASVSSLAEAVIREIKRPMSIEGRHIALSLGIGVVVAGADDRNVTCILRRADLALIEAKATGHDRYAIFEPAMEGRFNDRATLGRELRDAIELDQLELHYQPIFSAVDRRIVCMEALVRWRHPARGLIAPGVFIPLAEETGLILPLGDWVMRKACADAAEWPSDISVAVNVSSPQIGKPDFVDAITRTLEQTGLPASRLQVEITESVLLQDDRQTIAALGALHDMGVSFALDDFGTGYASLAYLKSFPLDKLKIDKCFVDDICTNPQSIAIVSAVVTLARGMGIVTTAEGVETREQLETLSAIGVATMQGYYLGKPKPIEEQDLHARTERAA